ncbi:MAG TPA: PA2169 family four-helix-bundle protein [Pirellulaceae bacterium]|nr:PA2169 family four-helix-bundle protein [Pirellulaceae bacterium]
MSVETKLTLNSETVAMLQDLIQINLDSRDGFRHAAKSVEEVAVSSMFIQLAAERDRQAFELQALVNNNGETPTHDGSFAASAHRTWMDIRTAVGGGLVAVLQEAERGEDYIKGQYESSIKKNPATAVSDVLHRQYAAVKSAHDRIRDMRDAHAEK